MGMHESPIICIAFSKDSELIASGDQDGKVKVWKLLSGQCARLIEKAHNDGVSSIAFSKDGTQLLTGSFDNTARIHGLKSGKTIKEFRGHSSYVNAAIYNTENTKVITASSDGRVKVFDAKSTECLTTFTPPPPAHMNSDLVLSVNTVALVPRAKDSNAPELIYVCNRSNTIYQMNLHGQVIKTLSSGKRDGGDLVSITISPKGDWIYGVGEDHTLYSFSNETGALENMMTVATKDVIGVAHHPHMNMMASYSIDSTLALLVP